jgi:hypothetical protein
MRHIFGIAVIVALFAIAPVAKIVGVSVSARGQQSSPPSTTQQEHEHTQPSAQPNTQDMMKMHQQMMADMNAADAKLDQLVQQMNAASGEAKVDATAAVVTELVRQQKSMHAHMGKMHDEMMGGMMMKK